MTDFIGLKLGLDTSQFPAGAKLAGDSLETISNRFARAESSGLRFEGTARNIFSRGGALGGTIQVAGGINSLAQAFQAMNVQAALFAGSRLVLEVGDTIRDYKQLTDQVVGTTAVMSTAAQRASYDSLGLSTALGTVSTTAVATSSKLGALWAVVAANPVVAFIGVLSLAATGMALFGKETEETEASFKELAKTLKSARIADLAAIGLGTPERKVETTQLQVIEGTYRRLLELQRTSVGLIDKYAGNKPGEQGIRDFANLAGSKPVDVARYFVQNQSENAASAYARDYVRTGSFPGSYPGIRETDLNKIQITINDQLAFLRLAFERLSNEAGKPLSSPLDKSRGRLAGGMPGSDGLAKYPGYFSSLEEQDKLDASVREGRDLELAQERLEQEARLRQIAERDESVRQERAQRAAEELLDTSRQIGDVFADAGGDFLLKLRDAKQIAASIASDFLRAGLRQAGTQIAAFALGQFNTTPGQATTGVVSSATPQFTPVIAGAG